jgi:hypothetical protein
MELAGSRTKNRMQGHIESAALTCGTTGEAISGCGEGVGDKGYWVYRGLVDPSVFMA